MSAPAEPSSPKSFLRHARLISAFTLASRLLGLVREMVAGHYLGTGLVASAFTVAFTIPNLFRKLLGEGALSQAFIPLYAQAIQRGETEAGEEPAAFASASVKLLAKILLGITIVGEAVLAALIYTADSARPDRLLMLQFAAVMLPYVMLVCGGALLAAILQVQKRFGPPAFAPVILNALHIVVVIGGAAMLHLQGDDPATAETLAAQTKLAFLLAGAVLLAGVLQVAVLWPALRSIGFQMRWRARNWTPDTRTMLRMSIPVAVGAAVLQLSVLADKAISYGFMQGQAVDGTLITHFTAFGSVVAYPLEIGAVRRLDLAQLMYQFPLGVFAIALATALFPALSAGAADPQREQFKVICRQGVETALWEGLPASVGLILVAGPAVRLMFQHGQITAHDASLIAYSTMFYAGGIWAYSLLQIINRAYYALRDTRTPLYASAANLVLNLVIELPLIWVMGEAGMAVGTLVSFSLQAILMLYLLDRRVGGIGFGVSAKRIGKIVLATGVMTLICLVVRFSPIYPTGETRWIWAAQLTLITVVGGVTYLLACRLLGANLPRTKRAAVKA
ncbi:MAG TPA: murein biosynthesis integral membrane protein MurJ [Tepidisphaeraceae bacterium]